MATQPDSWRVVVFSAATAFMRPQAGRAGRHTDDYRDLIQYTRPGVELIISNYPDRQADMIRPLRPDLIQVAGFNWKIPASVLEIPQLGTLNGHDSLLPKYQGQNAIGWALRNDEPEFGATFHYMVPDFDTEPILAQRSIPIMDDDYAIDQLFPRAEGLEGEGNPLI